MSGGTSPSQRFYGRWARLYDLVARRTPRIGGLRARTADALDLSAGETAVEMGCGTGANLPHLRERVGPEGRVLGLDFTRGVLDRAAADIDRRGWENVHLARADVTSEPLCEPVDGIVASFVVGMLADPAGAVERWCDHLRPGGRIALLNAARSERWYGPLVNAPFRGLVIVSTPGDRPSAAHELLDRRIEAAHDALRRRCTDVTHEEHALGIVRLTAGTVE